jgi:molybdopterin biosynthesis enzyme MoaB
VVFAETPLFMDFTLEGLEELLRSISIKEVAEAASKRILDGLT